ncbi:hypothetical protein [Thiothrix nivea]|uniref:Uncharacterized protein n=1 Tax=Thiothrix nivea (strain ATCC 35100 / DSM 5205 / JP2) TaxID=870187 RepID=A0A656HJP3_THINJ|nr:hypothetical protein [Thiothrix nivea]EIJ35726.1 hypothetical protein Thini_3204 [Thiothrix nivea DSM 5205]
MSKDLPKWMQHANGDIPDPTPDEIAEDSELHHRLAFKWLNNIPLTPEEKRRDDAMWEAISTYYQGMDGKASSLLARVDWQKVFIVTARALAVLAVGALTFQYSKYFAAFGAGAIAFMGQFTMGIFFLVAILQSTNGLQIMTAALGLYLLVNSF